MSADEKALRDKHNACPHCRLPTWHNGATCPSKAER